MKKAFTLLVTFFAAAAISAQIPQPISFQVVIYDVNNQVVTTQTGMQISILQGSSEGMPVYIETHTPLPNDNGLVTIEIGNTDPVSFAAIDWSAGPFYIKYESDPNGGTNYTSVSTSQILSVPYAINAKSAGGHYIGEFFGGGIIVSVVKTADAEHGLIASLTNLGPDPGSTWGDTALIGTAAQSMTDGLTNTIAIISQPANTTTAANLCYDYVNPDKGTGVFSDWYLPSMRELEECYKANYAVTNILGTVDGFRFDNYWSSTENKNDKLTSYFKYFHLGILSPGGHRWHLLRVRAVRQF